jgi:hypothetical protein
LARILFSAIAGVMSMRKRIMGKILCIPCTMGSYGKNRLSDSLITQVTGSIFFPLSRIRSVSFGLNLASGRFYAAGKTDNAGY